MIPRRSQIAGMCAAEGEVSVEDLARRFGVTPMTIRRDLAALEAGGRLVRTHGGAVLARPGIIEFQFREQGLRHAAEKRAIAARVARHIEPGMTITLDTGTTALEVAHAIAGKTPLTVLTSSLVIASALYARDGIELVLLGGTARKGSPDLSGWLTEQNLGHFRVDVAVVGADGADPDGVYTTDGAVARVSATMIANARKCILAMDHSKFERAAFVQFAKWRAFHAVVTDTAVPRHVRRWLAKTGPDVAYVQVR